MSGFLILIGMVLFLSYWLWLQIKETKEDLIEIIDSKVNKHEEVILKYVDNVKKIVDGLQSKKAKPTSQPKTFSPSRVKASPQQAKRIRASKGSGKK